MHSSSVTGHHPSSWSGIISEAASLPVLLLLLQEHFVNHWERLYHASAEFFVLHVLDHQE